MGFNHPREAAMFTFEKLKRGEELTITEFQNMLAMHATIERNLLKDCTRDNSTLSQEKQELLRESRKK